ncbi:hypothetical protein Pmani_008003 [Petrolisthes manimaculis]|uniref:Uncharacterized protein n=1 Tax=Petrolisthes manimaculis TaxID=1843537 RepID=A0AAE1Q7U7_9EUCA|nr:hypothetical protein Pmani_008003 [Petrolisthes manimaculis]
MIRQELSGEATNNDYPSLNRYFTIFVVAYNDPRMGQAIGDPSWLLNPSSGDGRKSADVRPSVSRSSDPITVVSAPVSGIHSTQPDLSPA